MINSNAFEQETTLLLRKAEAELAKINKKIVDFEKQAEVYEEQVTAYKAALQVYKKSMGTLVSSEPNWRIILAKGSSHKERIILIAKEKGGRIKTSEVTDILFSNGFIQTKKRSTAYTIVQVSLTDMMRRGKIEKIGSGEYRLRVTNEA